MKFIEEYRNIIITIINLLKKNKRDTYLSYLYNNNNSYLVFLTRNFILYYFLAIEEYNIMT